MSICCTNLIKIGLGNIGKKYTYNKYIFFICYMQYIKSYLGKGYSLPTAWRDEPFSLD